MSELTASIARDRRAAAGPRPTTRRARLRADRRRATLACRAARRADHHPGSRFASPTICGSVEQALVENLHRQDLTALEEAAAYQQLIEDFDLTHEQVADSGGQEPVGDHQHVCGCWGCRRRSSTCSPMDSCRPDTHGAARNPRSRRSRSSWPGEAVAEGGRSARSRRPSDATANRTARRTDRSRRASGTIDGAGLTPATKLRPPGLLELEQLLAEHLETTGERADGGQAGQGRASTSPIWRISSGSTAADERAMTA